MRDFRAKDADTPIVLMGYFNPIYVYPSEKFVEEAAAAGVDGLIVVDLPPEADDELCLPAMAKGLNFIRLATPTTDAKRLPAVLNNTSGFVYYVSIAGITGAAAPDPAAVGAQVAAVKKATTLPVCVGFGVRTPEQAKEIAAFADGVVVGSALVGAVEKSLDAKGKAPRARPLPCMSLVASLAKAVRAGSDRTRQTFRPGEYPVNDSLGMWRAGEQHAVNAVTSDYLTGVVTGRPVMGPQRPPLV